VSAGGTGAENYLEYNAGCYMYTQPTGYTDKWRYLIRGIFGFDLSSIQGGATVAGATFSVYGWGKLDNLGVAPDLNVYSAIPAGNTALEAGDYDSLGTAAYATPIGFADWNTGDPGDINDFVFNSTGIAAVQAALGGIFNIGTRNANYDVADELDPNNHDPEWTAGVASYLFNYYADKGSGYKPKLVVTYDTGGDKYSSDSGMAIESSILGITGTGESGAGIESGNMAKAICGVESGSGNDAFTAVQITIGSSTEMKLPGRAGRTRMPSKGVNL